MADFSPTGYWALYQEGDGITYLPVASFDFVTPPRKIAMVGNDDGWLVPVNELEGFGDFVMITSHPVED